MKQRRLRRSLISLLILFGYSAVDRLTGINGLPLPFRVAAKGTYVAGAFLALKLILQPRVTFERIVYVWRLAVRKQEDGSVNH